MLVNPGELLTNLEENAISLTEGITNIFNQTEVTPDTKIIEPFSQYDNENSHFVNSMNRFDKFNNPDNFGSYLPNINNTHCSNDENNTFDNNSNYNSNTYFDKMNKNNLDIEGFQNSSNKKMTGNKKNSAKNNAKNNTNNNSLKKFVNGKDRLSEKYENTEDDDGSDTEDDDSSALDKLMGGDFINGFLKYVLDTGSKFMNNYDKKFDELGNLIDKKDNMMTFGLGLIILSIVLYLADITS